MTIPSTLSDRRIRPVTASLFRRQNLIWIAIGLALSFYAYLAAQSGWHNLPFNSDPQRIELLDKVQRLSNEGAPYSAVAKDAQEAFPVWNNIMAWIAGTHYGFGTNGVTEPTRFYATMTAVQKSALSTHMILGSACIVLGVFQFWPWFRRTYRRVHRALGVLYILCAFTMVFASMYHLIHTGIENTYQGFTFYIQLWFLVISTLVTQTLALYFLAKRNISLHFSFQSYTYAAFLSAPLQRYDWFTFGWFYPHLSQGEVNNLVNIMGFWECLLMAYLILVWNRAASPLRPKAPEKAATPKGKQVVISVFAGVGILTAVAQYLLFPGLGSWTAPRAIVPASTIAADALLFDGKSLQNVIFTLALVSAMICGTWLMLFDTTARRVRKTFYVSAIVAGLFQLSWGWQLGEPNMRVISGGGFYMLSGLSIIGFTLGAIFLEISGLWEEIMVLAVNFAFVPVLLLWMHAIWYMLDVIPQHYLDVGHGYILAAGGAILFPMFNGFFGSFTSAETRARAIY